MPARRGTVVGWAVTAALVILVFVVVFVVVFFGARAWRRGADVPAPAQYDERTRTAFLAACTEGAGAGSEPVCGCAYERLLASVPFAQYVSLEEQVKQRRPVAPARGTPPGSKPSGTVADTLVPDALATILVDCVAYNRQLGTPPDSGGAPGTPGSRPGTTPPGTLRLAPS